MRAVTPDRGYRPDIDGLRAFAVLAVVIFHAFPKALAGGFIGVDVFFVISGYLICGIILRDLDQGSFSFRNFYGRRIRRIFPALALVLAFAVIFGWFALYPEEYRALGKHVSGGAAFVSNLLLWREAGYFDAAASAKPLLHLWSLGIEEQFYIFFPLLLWLCAQKRLSALITVGALCLLSFGDNIFTHRVDRVADFYSPCTRIWELLCGALLAAGELRSGGQTPQLRRRTEKTSAFLALVGTTCLAAALLFARESDPYPGWKALWPVAGALCLIAAGPDTPINRRFLATPCLVFVGKISYPLYLWHWVLISYAHIVNSGLGEQTGAIRAGLVGIAFVLSVFTYLFIERPIRFGAQFKRRKTLSLVVIMVCIAATGYIIYQSYGFPRRFPGGEQIKDITIQEQKAEKHCYEILPSLKDFKDTGCKFNNKEKFSTVAIVGDSHAEHLFAGLITNKSNAYDTMVFYGGCTLPYLNLVSRPGKEFKKRSEIITIGFQYIIENKNIHTVFLAHNPSCSYGMVADTLHPELTDFVRIMQNGIRRTLDLLIQNDKRVIIVLTVPLLSSEPQKCNDRPFSFIESNNFCKFSKKNLRIEDIPFQWYRNIVEDVVHDYPEVKILNLADALCDQDFCYLSKNNTLLYRDTSHLSIAGSIYVSDALLDAIGNPVP